jgi:7,8-dihydro-6-hydroxymethylpterin-pyrophosphokinase
METQKAEVKKEKTGTCSHDLRNAFINKIPQGLKDRKSFTLNVVKIDVKPSNVDNLIDWLRRNEREDRADEIEANRERFFDISILTDDGNTELFNSGILSYDKKNTLEKLIVKSQDGYDYFISSMTWDADNKNLLFA